MDRQQSIKQANKLVEQIKNKMDKLSSLIREDISKEKLEAILSQLDYVAEIIYYG